MMRLLLAVLLTGCASAPLEPVPLGPCVPPTFKEPGCVVPGCDRAGCVVRCPQGDGTYWDLQGSGMRVHWNWGGDGGVETICEVNP